MSVKFTPTDREILRLALPNIVQKDHSSLINGIVDILKPIELQSDPIYQKLGRTGPNKGLANMVKPCLY